MNYLTDAAAIANRLKEIDEQISTLKKQCTGSDLCKIYPINEKIAELQQEKDFYNKSKNPTIEVKAQASNESKVFKKENK